MSSDDTPQVRVRTRQRAITTEEPTPAPPRDPMDPGPMHNWPELPRNADGELIPEAVQHRVRTLRQIDPDGATEFIFETLHMLLLQHRPIDDIARLFGVNVKTVWRWRQKLRARMSSDLRSRVPSDMAAEQIANFKRTKAYAWQQAAKCSDPVAKWRWVNTTMKCEQQIQALLQDIKMYKAVEPRREIDDNGDDGATSLAKIAEEFLTGGYSGAKKSKEGKSKTQDIDADLVPAVEESDDLLF